MVNQKDKKEGVFNEYARDVVLTIVVGMWVFSIFACFFFKFEIPNSVEIGFLAATGYLFGDKYIKKIKDRYKKGGGDDEGM